MSKNLTASFPDPKISTLLFVNTKLSLLWLPVRLYVGWGWLYAGYEKIINPVWVGPKAGVALNGFLTGALAKTQGAHPDVASWYGGFLQGFVAHNLVAFSYLISFGEFFVGVALILGAFTGVAAFFGAFMNVNYLLAGTVSTNPILFIIEIFLMLAWRVAGWWGLDRILMPLLGTPWKPGKLFKK